MDHRNGRAANSGGGVPSDKVAGRARLLAALGEAIDLAQKVGAHALYVELLNIAAHWQMLWEIEGRGGAGVMR